ncbi:hypothetical protein BKA12_000781 [Neomicrococcus lactis]|uniref:Uncharacterized protein n=1 Tax=Neomicrococcus lactis TaxID=732241 RepID=A0A7W8YA15_9MICC|nr:hypothetical protein [Neomicrococcus lactis]
MRLWLRLFSTTLLLLLLLLLLLPRTLDLLGHQKLWAGHRV